MPDVGPVLHSGKPDLRNRRVRAALRLPQQALFDARPVDVGRLFGAQSRRVQPKASKSCLGLFVLAFGVSLGPLPDVLMSELFPLAL